MKAILFSAGLGTRFKPWTDHHPKALALVNGKTLLQRNIEYLQQYGITEVVVNVHHFADQIVEAIATHDGWGSRIEISDEKDVVLETGGGLLKARPLLETGEPFVSLNVDVLTDFDLNALIHFQKVQQSLVAFAVSERPSSRNILLDAANQMCGWQNNQTGETKLVRHEADLRPVAYSCVVVYHPEIFRQIRQTGKFSIMETYLDLAAEYPIHGFPHQGDRWVDVGRPESVAVAERLFL